MTNLPSISLQLYSVRDAMEHDAQATIDRIAAIGYTQVEASYRSLSANPRLGPAILAAGLTSPSMTGTLVGADRAPVFETAKELGAHAVIDTLVREDHWTTRSRDRADRGRTERRGERGRGVRADGRLPQPLVGAHPQLQRPRRPGGACGRA